MTSQVASRILRCLGRVPLLRTPYKRLPESVRARVHRLAHDVPDVDVSFPRLPAATAAGPVPVAASSARWAGAGANVFAYFRGEFGLAESARLYTRAVMAVGFPLALIDVDLDLPHGFDESSFSGLLEQNAPYPVSIIFVNPDYLDSALDAIGQSRLEGRYTVACWFWELEDLPPAWLPALEKVDEVLVASEFVAEAVRRAGRARVTKIPLPLYPLRSSGLKRRDFGLDEQAFIFLVTFDFNSFIERKNPFAAVEAFRTAFPERKDVRLLIKTSNGRRQPHKLRQLLDKVRDDPRILVRDEVLPRMHVTALMECVDAYVSTHRSEGFGLGLAECMALGKPVIGTGWSGNLEFMDASNSLLVGYDFVAVGPLDYPGGEGARWAEVDVRHVAAAMRRLLALPDRGRALGEAARASVQERLCPDRIGLELAHHLQRICTRQKAQAPSEPSSNLE